MQLNRTLPAALALILPALCVIADNASTNHVCKFKIKTIDQHISPPEICVTNLSAGGPYALTGTNVTIIVSGKAVPIVKGTHEIKYIHDPAICDYVDPNGIPCGKTNNLTLPPSYPETKVPNNYVSSWFLTPGSGSGPGGQSFSGTNSVSAPGPYTLMANFKADRSDCTACSGITASGTTNCTVYKIEIVVELEDPKINSVRSGLNLGTLKFILNGKQIDYARLTIVDEENEWLDGPIKCKVKVSYAPSLDELVTSPLVNQVTVDIEDNVKNVMDQQVKTFIFNSASGY